MKKRNIAVYGITESIYTVLVNSINTFKVNIMAFIDSDKNKQNLIYKKISIINPTKFDYSTVDYVIIAALSQYNQIKESLVLNGVNQNIIFPFIPNEKYTRYGIKSYFLDEPKLSKDSEYFNLYFHTDYVRKQCEEYTIQLKKYKSYKRYDDNELSWERSTNIVSHALGGLIDNSEQMYTNSMKALLTSLNNNFNVIECDVIKVDDKTFMCFHDGVNSHSSVSIDTVLITINNFNEKNHKNVKLLIDIKWWMHSEFQDVVNYIDDFVIKNKIDKNIIIFEVYDKRTIEIIRSFNYECFFTQYMREAYFGEEKQIFEFICVANICMENNIKVVGYYSSCCENPNFVKQLKIFHDKNIAVYCYSTNSIEELSKLKSNGIQAVFTDYLIEDKNYKFL